jgi:hypothetical protein
LSFTVTHSVVDVDLFVTFSYLLFAKGAKLSSTIFYDVESMDATLFTRFCVH